jgi:hypothetical protein
MTMGEYYEMQSTHQFDESIRLDEGQEEHIDIDT